MTSWREEYLNALKARDETQKLDYGLIDAYTRLADRTAVLEAKTSVTLSTPSATATNRDRVSTPTPGDESTQLRSDLAEALRSKGQLQSRLKSAEDELDKFRQRSKSDGKMVKDLSAERAVLVIKVKDRDDELRGKAKLLEDVQNEMVSLNLQLNMAEQRSKKVKEENDTLVKRWMAQKSQEADDMNNASKFS